VIEKVLVGFLAMLAFVDSGWIFLRLVILAGFLRFS